MIFLKNIFGGGSSSSAPESKSDPNAMWLYIQCNKCGAPVAIRVDTRNDITTDYETGGRYLRKEIMDSTCFQLIYATVQFDASNNIVEKSIDKGKFLTKAEYDTALAAFNAKKTNS